MFDQPNTPSASNQPGQTSVEDIFAPAEPPAVRSQPAVGSPAPAAPAPVVTMPFETPRGGGHWLLWIGVAVLVVVVAAGAWYLFTRPEVTTPATGEPTVLEQPGQPTTGVTQTPTSPAATPTDTDGDGLSDEREGELMTDPRRADSDEDGLFDNEEVSIYQSNPLQFDSDGDGYSDGEEVRNGYSPTGPGRILELPTGA